MLAGRGSNDTNKCILPNCPNRTNRNLVFDAVIGPAPRCHLNKRFTFKTNKELSIFLRLLLYIRFFKTSTAFHSWSIDDKALSKNTTVLKVNITIPKPNSNDRAVISNAPS